MNTTLEKPAIIIEDNVAPDPEAPVIPRVPGATTYYFSVNVKEELELRLDAKDLEIYEARKDEPTEGIDQAFKDLGIE